MLLPKMIESSNAALSSSAAKMVEVSSVASSSSVAKMIEGSSVASSSSVAKMIEGSSVASSSSASSSVSNEVLLFNLNKFPEDECKDDTEEEKEKKLVERALLKIYFPDYY
ncbi:hypothetical protein AAZX31_20G077600 [Glycine max]